jgi:hypothetical protein
MALLALESQAEYDNLISGMEYHTHQPYASTTYNNNDEIRIPILQQDIITAPFESTIIVHGEVTGKKADGTALEVSLINNAVAFMFEEIRYELCGKEIDRTKNVGITTTLKNILSSREEEKNVLKNSGWVGPGNNFKNASKFIFSIPLKRLLGFGEDYKRVLVNVKQELVLLRSSTDNNAVITTEAGTITVNLEKVYWRIPHVTLNDEYKLKLYNFIEKDPAIHVPFRQWELVEYPNLPQSDSFSWSIKVSSSTERPRFIVLAFHTARKNNIMTDMSKFDACDLQDVKLYLNSNFYPYDNIRGNKCLFYDMYTAFQSSYYGRIGSPTLSYDDFTNNCPIYVIDCSKQNDSIKIGTVDVRLEIFTSKAIPASTCAYCLILHDTHYTYTPITGDVRKISI